VSIGEHDERPWGSYTVLDEGDGFKVKRIVVAPGQRLSLQRHAQRAEHWVAVSGVGVAAVDGAELPLAAGGAVDVPRGATHRAVDVPRGATHRAVDVPRGATHRAVAGPDAPLVFIEVQRGGYLGEDDIERLDDDYGRVG
jgi:mannose-6-phosphate isomerase